MAWHPLHPAGKIVFLNSKLRRLIDLIVAFSSCFVTQGHFGTLMLSLSETLLPAN